MPSRSRKATTRPRSAGAIIPQIQRCARGKRNASPDRYREYTERRLGVSTKYRLPECRGLTRTDIAETSHLGVPFRHTIGGTFVTWWDLCS
jgi:hypothetical protein